MKRRGGDRRTKPRFEIVGDLWGSVDATAAMQVVNLGRGGALLETTLPLAAESVHWVTALADDQPHLVQIRVRHSAAAAGPAGHPRYRVGVEFLKLSPGVEEVILRHLGAGGSGLSAGA